MYRLQDLRILYLPLHLMHGRHVLPAMLRVVTLIKPVLAAGFLGELLHTLHTSLHGSKRAQRHAHGCAAQLAAALTGAEPSLLQEAVRAASSMYYLVHAQLCCL